jgi:Tol biopolymer transport system component
MVKYSRFGGQVTLALSTGLVATGAAFAMPSFGDWAAPALIEDLSESSSNLNTTFVDGCASQSRDGLSLYFNSNRSGTQDIYVARRSTTSEGFGDPVRLPAPVNTTDKNEACPTIRAGGQLYFSSDREDPAYDLYVSKDGPKGWRDPENLGPNINAAGQLDESAAFYDADDGSEVMVFCRRQGASGKIYQSIDGAPATLVQGGPHSSAADCRPSVTHDGKTIFFDSTRTGGLGAQDLYYSTRSSTSEVWGPAVHLQSLSSPGFDARPSVSWDGRMLTYSSVRTGNEGAAPDIWFSTRE